MRGRAAGASSAGSAAFPPTDTLGLVVSSPQGAAAERPKLRVKPTKVKAGKSVIIEGWVPACPGTIDILSRAFKRGGDEFAGMPRLRAKVRKPRGYFKKKTTIPRETAPDKYRISARCGGGRVGGVTLRVLRADPLPANPGLPANPPPPQSTDITISGAVSVRLTSDGLCDTRDGNLLGRWRASETDRLRYLDLDARPYTGPGQYQVVTGAPPQLSHEAFFMGSDVPGQNTGGWRGSAMPAGSDAGGFTVLAQTAGASPTISGTVDAIMRGVVFDPVSGAPSDNFVRASGVWRCTVIG